MSNISYAVFCDFDGTITNNDLLDIIVDIFHEPEYRLNIDNKILNKEIEHNKALEILFSKVNISFIEAVNKINIKCNNKVINNTFESFYNNCKTNNIPIYIISGGFKLFIKHYLPFVCEQDIYANDIYIDETNKWNLSFITKSLDKELIINTICNDRQYSYMKYYGDGISDVGVVNIKNIHLYAKSKSFLEKYCKENNISYQPFTDFNL